MHTWPQPYCAVILVGKMSESYYEIGINILKFSLKLYYYGFNKKLYFAKINYLWQK